MPGPREHVDRLGGLRAVAFFDKEAEVAGEGRGVAGDVEDVIGCQGDELFEETRGAAFSRGIEDDGQGTLEIKALVVVVFGEADVEFGVGDGVDLGVAAGVFDGLRAAFDADDPVGTGGQVETDAPGAAVEIENVRTARCVCHIQIFRNVRTARCLCHIQIFRNGRTVRCFIRLRILRNVCTIANACFFEKLQDSIVQTLGLHGIDLKE